jgi:hypothetical protein
MDKPIIPKNVGLERYENLKSELHCRLEMQRDSFQTKINTLSIIIAMHSLLIGMLLAKVLFL